MAKANLNPAEAHRKALQKKEVKKNKAARKTNRDAAIAKKDTFELEESIRKLTEQEDAGKLSADDAARLKDQRFELSRIKKIKEAYIKDHPDEAHKVYRSAPRVKQDAQEAPRGRDGRKLRARRIFDEKTGLPRHPERSLYYDPLMNPYGVPPPGMPYAERPLLPGEVDSEAEDESSEDEQDEDEDDIPMPPDHDPELDDIPMPEGPPPGVEDDADFVPPLPDGPPPLASEPPPLPPAAPPLPMGVPPLPLGVPPGFIPPPPPGGPPVIQAGFVPPPPPGFPPGAAGAAFIAPLPPGGPPGSMGFIPPPPPGGPPGFAIPPPPPGGPPGFAVPPPPPGFAIPPPPPGAPPHGAQQQYYPPPPPPLAAFYAQPPLPPLPPARAAAAHTPFVPPPSARLPRRPDAPPAVIAAEPELRDLRKEATAFVPAALRKRKAGAGGEGGGAGGRGGVNAAAGVDGVEEVVRPPDLGEALRKKVKRE